jgi:hypothetical protein
VPSNRARGAEGQNNSRSIVWAGKQEKFQLMEMCFFLTSPFIELIRPAELNSRSVALQAGIMDEMPSLRRFRRRGLGGRDTGARSADSQFHGFLALAPLVGVFVGAL